MGINLWKGASIKKRCILFFSGVLLLSSIPAVKILSNKEHIKQRREVEEMGLTPLRFALNDMESNVSKLLVVASTDMSAHDFNNAIIKYQGQFNEAVDRAVQAANLTEVAYFSEGLSRLRQQENTYFDALKSSEKTSSVDALLLINEINNLQGDVSLEYDNHIEKTNSYIGELVMYFLLFLAFIFLQCFGFLAYALKLIGRPIDSISGLLRKLSKGELPESYKVTDLKDFQEMTEALEAVGGNLASASVFAKQIGEGNLDEQFNINGEHDLLGNALVDMRQQLKVVNEKEKRRLWKIEGLADLTKIIRNDFDELHLLGDAILLHLVKYLGAVQGAFYVVGEQNNQSGLDQVSTYAYDRKKYIDRFIPFGHGLIGQACLDQQSTYMTEIPADFVRITSGLGDTPPRALAIIPLVNNEKVEGVLEISSFDPITDYQLEFLEEVAQAIAMTIYNARTNEQTSRLLKETQGQSEQMRAQEEELRQNMEEMQATHEQLNRLQETQKEEAAALKTDIELKDILINHALANDEAWMLINHNGQVHSANQHFASALGYNSDAEMVDQPFSQAIRHQELLAQLQAMMEQAEMTQTPVQTMFDEMELSVGTFTIDENTWYWVKQIKAGVLVA